MVDGIFLSVFVMYAFNQVLTTVCEKWCVSVFLTGAYRETFSYSRMVRKPEDLVITYCHYWNIT